MRARTVRPEFFQDEDLAERSFAARMLFVGLWTMADKAGRLEDRPKKIRAAIFPYDPTIDIDGLLAELSAPKQSGMGAFIVRYTGEDGRNYIEVSNFTKYQHCHPKEPTSTFPGPAVESHGSPGKATARNVPTIAGQSGPSGPSGPSGSSGPSAIASPPAPQPTPAKADKGWLAPYLAAWTARTGGDLTPGMAAKFLAPLRAKHGGDGTVLARWAVYLAATEPQFCSAKRFSETFGTWAHPPAPSQRVGNWDTPDVSERAREYAREPDPDPEEVARLERWDQERREKLARGEALCPTPGLPS